MRPNLAGASVLPFQFPPLTEVPTATVDTADFPVDGGSLDAAEKAAPPPANATNDAGAEPDAEVVNELARARAEAVRRGFEEGHQEGYAAGVAEGREAGEASVVEAARRLAAIAARLGGPLTALEQPVEEAVAALALEVARCVIGGEVKRSRESLVRLIREAIAKVQLEMAAPCIILNPADLDLVRRMIPEIAGGGATLAADEAIEAGGCLVVADGDEQPLKDRRWNPRNAGGVSQVNLTLASRWREVMLTLFDGEDE